MIGSSLPDAEFIKLSHFDRVRRGYFDKVPLNFMLIGSTMAVNVFLIENQNICFMVGIAMLILGLLFKEKCIDKDDAELKQNAKQIELEFQKREKFLKQKGLNR